MMAIACTSRGCRAHLAREIVASYELDAYEHHIIVGKYGHEE